MRGNSPFTISGGGMGVFEGQGFASAANMGQISSGFMGDFGAAKTRKGRGAPVSVQTGTSPGEYPAGRGRKARKGGGGGRGIPMSVHNPRSTQQGMRSSVVSHDATAPDSSLVLRRTMPSTRAQVRNGRVNVDFNKINLDRSSSKYALMGISDMQSMPPGPPGSRGGYGEQDMFGLGQTGGRGFGQQMGGRGSGPGLYYGNQDMFGLGAVSGPLSNKNAPLVAVAAAAVAEYQKNRSLISRLPMKSQQTEASAIVSKKWWPTGFLSRGRYNLDELMGKVQSALPLAEPFYRMIISGNSITIDSRYAEYLNAFQKGNRALRNYMAQFIPTQLAPVVTEREILRTVGLDSATLIFQASAAATKARASRLPNDVIAARTIADTARSAAEAEGDMGAENLAAANSLFSEMDDLAKQVGAPPAAQGGTPSKFPMIPVVIGGVAILGIVGYLMFAKK